MSTPEEYVLMEVVLREAPTRIAAAAQLGVKPEDIDEGYGLVAVDPDEGRYALKVRADRVKPSKNSEYRGPYSNPSIGHFGGSKDR